MMIKSDFKDYYDSAQSLGFDSSQIFMRFKKNLEIGKKRIFSRYVFGSRDKYFPLFGSFSINYLDIENIIPKPLNIIPKPLNIIPKPLNITDQRIIGFCGKIHGVLSITTCEKAGSVQKFCYNIEDVDALVQDNFKHGDFENYQRKGYRRSDSWDRRRKREDFVDYFESIEKVRDKFEHLFIEAHSPLFVSQLKYTPDRRAGAMEGIFCTEVIFNASLKDYEFFRIFKPYAAFQEISMFLNNMAEPRKKIPELSNSDKIEAAGHDLKTSFRKPKT